MLSNLSQQIKKSTEVLRTEIEQLRHELSENHKIMNETVEKLMGENRLLTKLQYLENQNRKNNLILIFWGIEEMSETECKEESEQKVRQILMNKLDIECAVSDESLQIETVEKLMGENRLLTKLQYLENQNRKNNLILIFWGIEEMSETECKEDSEQKVWQFLMNKLDIECAVSDESLQIENVFQLALLRTWENVKGTRNHVCV
ncbi:hypothetical protein SNE40_014316 [Patella caerulea]|uniref:Uncharacterized protein n=1 Tax=Patella caerulea TaxID=87958 RepID=A0AAN8JKX0_PATCE